MAQDGADGLGDVGRRKHGQRHLVEQRLKGVVVAAVDYGDVDRQVREAFGGVKAGKAPPTMTTRGRCAWWLRCFVLVDR